MIRVELNNANLDLGFKEFEKEIDLVMNLKTPDFARVAVDTRLIKRIAKKYSHYKNLIIIGNGGAINSFRAFYEALAKQAGKKNVFILNTPEPDYINYLNKNLSKKKTLVLSISKSGTNITNLEATAAFMEYPVLAITTKDSGALFEIAKKKGWDIIYYPPYEEYPDLDDRFTGATASGLGPAAICGINIDKITSGIKEAHAVCAPKVGIKDNPALALACALYSLDLKGYGEIFCLIYSTKLVGFLPLVVQLMHETICKDGKGQTVYGDLAPECQHHTNQRFFGGKKNAIGLFIDVKCEDKDSKVLFPEDYADIKLRNSRLKDIIGISYAKSLAFEMQGTYQDAVNKKIPVVKISIGRVDERSVGQFLGFLQYLAVYSGIIRNVNPYGQPQVESSKEISFMLRKKYKKE